MVLDFHLNSASIVSIQGGKGGMPFQGATECIQRPSFNLMAVQVEPGHAI